MSTGFGLVLSAELLMIRLAASGGFALSGCFKTEPSQECDWIACTELSLLFSLDARLSYHCELLGCVVDSPSSVDRWEGWGVTSLRSCWSLLFVHLYHHV